MDYIKIYNALIEKRKNSPAKGYKESHHIIPRCLGGSDESNNLVDLTYKEHYLAHVLLTKIYPDNADLAYAIFLFSSTTGSMYSYSREKAIDWLRIREISEETRLRMSASQLDRFSKPGSKDYLIGREISEETKALQSSLAKKRFEDAAYKERVLKNLELSRSLNGPSMLGKSHRKESCDKMISTWREKGQPILRYDFETKEFIRFEYPSDASREYGIKSSNICACCKKNLDKGKKKPNKSLGYSWLYDSEESIQIFMAKLLN